MAFGLKSHIYSNKLSTWWTIAVPVVYLLIYYLVYLKYSSLPQPLMGNDCKIFPDRFCAENAIRITKNLTQFGPRITGTDVNEIGTVKYLLDEIESLAMKTLPEHQIEYELQQSSNDVHIPSKITVYQGIQNVLVRFTGSGVNTNSSILINSHFDTMAASPGAGDAAIMVSIMLETLRVLSQTNSLHVYPITFLFNGATLNGLQGSHSFMKLHRWAHHIGMFINLESKGAAGREMLLESTRRSPHLLKWYADSVKYPFGSSITADLINFGWLLREWDTDYNIYSQFTQVPSMHLSLVSNGYVHSTKNDVPSTIPMGTYQNIGENLLNLCNHPGEFDDRSDDALFDLDKFEEPDTIYFDYLGLVLIRYRQDAAVMINIISTILTLALIVVTLAIFAKHFEITILRIIFEFLQILFVQMMSIILALGSVLILAIIYDCFGGSMRWYSNNWLIGFIYYCPAIIALLVAPLTCLWWKQRLQCTEAYVLTLPVFVQMCLHAHNIILIMITWILTAFDVRSAYVLIMIILFYGIALIVNIFCKYVLCDHRWIFIHIISQLPSFVYLTYCFLFFVDIYGPMLGRNSPTKNPEFVMALLTGFISIAQFGLIAPMIVLFRKPKIIVGLLFGIFVGGVIIMCTPIGFPYRTITSEQHFSVYHVKRTIHGLHRSVRQADSGFFVQTSDRHGIHFLNDFVYGMSSAWDLRKDCELYLMCGLPLLVNPEFINSYKWIPSKEPTLKEPPLLLLTNITSIQNDTKRYYYQLTGPSRMNLYFSPVKECTLTEWSISELPWKSHHMWAGRDEYRLYLSYGIRSGSFEFYLDFRCSPVMKDQYTFDIAIAAKCINDKGQRTHEFKEFLKQFPNWTSVVPCLSSFESWQI